MVHPRSKWLVVRLEGDFQNLKQCGMNVKQKLSILFFLKRKKITKDGKVPIYIRITIDGLEDELSLGCKTRLTGPY